MIIYGRLDVFFVNVGIIGFNVFFIDVDLFGFMEMMCVNFLFVFLVVKYVVLVM